MWIGKLLQISTSQNQMTECYHSISFVKPCTFVGLGLALPCMLTPNPRSWLLEIKLGGVSRSEPVMILFPSLCSFGHVNFTSLSLSRSLSLSLSPYIDPSILCEEEYDGLVVIFCLYSLKYASAV